jgi:hypothetical protein
MEATMKLDAAEKRYVFCSLFLLGCNQAKGASVGDISRAHDRGWPAESTTLAAPTIGLDSTIMSADKRSSDPSYVLLGWNDLGMHCYNNDASDIEVLPPYNNLWAQVVKVGDPPEIVSSGIAISYRFVDNTYSAGKTNFWEYAQQAFGLSQPLPPNIGLTGKGLAGTLDPSGDHFVAQGIPLTEYRDHRLKDPEPYQEAVLVARDVATRRVVAEARIVAPVSSEIRCDGCHGDDGDATTRYSIVPTGKVASNILAIHDYLNQPLYSPPLMSRRPVLCASCHASNALGTPGVPGVKSLSNAMHAHHKDLSDITPDTAGCYHCHPGPRTQCLRDTMSNDFAHNCTSCHGTMAQVALNENPWLNEPRCDNSNCHGAGYRLDQPLYRHSKGHGGTYCAGCHDSPHAIAPSRNLKDDLKFIALQGSPRTLSKCTVCHLTQPTSPFVHRWPAAQ